MHALHIEVMTFFVVFKCSTIHKKMLLPYSMPGLKLSLFYDMEQCEANPNGWAANYVDLMIITDEVMERSMHLWSVNNLITYSICPFWGCNCGLISPSLHQCNKNCPRTAFSHGDGGGCVSSSSTIRSPSGAFSRPTVFFVEQLKRIVSQSYRKQFWGAFSIAILCLRISVGVFMLNTLHGGKKEGDTQKLAKYVPLQSVKRQWKVKWESRVPTHIPFQNSILSPDLKPAL